MGRAPLLSVSIPKCRILGALVRIPMDKAPSPIVRVSMERAPL